MTPFWFLSLEYFSYIWCCVIIILADIQYLMARFSSAPLLVCSTAMPLIHSTLNRLYCSTTQNPLLATHISYGYN